MSTARLVLITESYPFSGGAEETFLEPELTALAERFADVTLVPRAVTGRRLTPPCRVGVDLSLAHRLSSVHGSALLWYRFRAACSPRLALALLRRPTKERVTEWRHAVRTRRDALVVRDWAADKLTGSSGKVLFYTYWLTSVTDGIAQAAKGRQDQIAVVSRGHRYDIYSTSTLDDVSRAVTVSTLRRLYPISRHGMMYIRDRYPDSADCVVARLGVRDPGRLSVASTDGVLRIVSCSFVVAVKRVHLLWAAIEEIARRDPSRRVEWTHIGDGPLWSALVDQVRAGPPNAVARLPGRWENARIIKEYLTRPADVFVNVSASEGIPVAIMEAQSCGIPVVATAVGGTPEIVSEHVGELLSPDPAAEEIADAVLRCCGEPRVHERKRVASRANWQLHYDAERNYAAFATNLASLGDTTGKGHAEPRSLPASAPSCR